jgi:23S rRNA (uracil1939-C5)-methyltransferase
MSRNYAVGDQIDVRIERIVPRGFGMAFVEGLTVLVSLAAPGDELTVRLTEIKKRLGFAEIVSINVSSKDRQEPPCKYFGECGGCDFQQLNYQAQLDAKVGIIRDSLKRIGKIEIGEIPVIASPPLEYRSRVRWQLDREDRTFGYYKRRSHDVIDVEYCPKLTPEMNATLGDLRASIDYTTIPEHLEISAVSGDAGAVSISSSVADESPTEVTWISASERYAFSADTFFQANRSLVPQLIDAALGETRGGVAFDLYSGVGLFTLPLARRFEKVVAVEEHPQSSKMCRHNLKNANLENAMAVTRSVHRFLSENRTKDVDLVVLDPPRAGTEKGVIKMLSELRPREISYISCDPSILARDLHELLDAGYEITSLTALDLFPQTHHVETVARLRLLADKSR